MNFNLILFFVFVLLSNISRFDQCIALHCARINTLECMRCGADCGMCIHANESPYCNDVRGFAHRTSLFFFSLAHFLPFHRTFNMRSILCLYLFMAYAAHGHMGMGLDAWAWGWDIIINIIKFIEKKEYIYHLWKSSLISIIVRRWRHLRHGINPTNQNVMFAQTIKRCAYRYSVCGPFSLAPSLWWAPI